MYEPLRYVWHDNWGQMASHLIGNMLVSLFFMTIGVSILIYQKWANNKAVSQLIAWCFILCGLSRFLSALCVWYDLYFITAIVSMMTGILAMVCTVFVFRSIKRLEELKSMDELQTDIERVEKKADALKTIKNENDNTSANDLL